MMDNQDGKFAKVLEFLQQEFPEHKISWKRGLGAETILELTTALGAKAHTIYLQDELLAITDADEIYTRLMGFRLAQVLREMGSFPIVVSRNGCIFG